MILDVIAIVGLLVIMSLPVTVYMLDRWGFEHADRDLFPRG